MTIQQNHVFVYKLLNFLLILDEFFTPERSQGEKMGNFIHMIKIVVILLNTNQQKMRKYLE